MATLYSKLKFFLEDNSLSWDNSKVKLENNGEGDFISMWEYSIAKPNDAQLDALESDADDYEYNLDQIAKRKAEYGTLEQQIENIMENGVTAEKTRVQSIKEKYPKK
jgi:hypothetical protein